MAGRNCYFRCLLHHRCTNLLGVQASAAATWIGLVFVAVFIHLAKINCARVYRDALMESILHFPQVFVIASVSLIPRQPLRALALEFTGVGVFFWSAWVLLVEILR